MTGRAGVRVLRAATGALIVTAVGATIATGSRSPTFSLGDLLSYFTVQSNLLAAGVLLVGAVAAPGARWWQALRGAATTYLIITAAVYGLVLSDTGLSLSGPWTNTVLHRLAPVLVVLDWLLLPPGRQLGARTAMAWLVYPLAYFGYTLARGPVADFYPYPFVDPRQPGGYGRVALNALALALAMAAVALAVQGAGRALSARRRRARAAPG